MKRTILIIMILSRMASYSPAQLHRESVFGLDAPIQRWNRNNDLLYFDGPSRDAIGQVSDIANLRFNEGADTVDVLVAVDYGASRIIWIRTLANMNPRPLRHIGSYGDTGDSTGQFISPYSICGTCLEDFHNPSIDHIYIGDRMRHSIVRLNFDFHPSMPESDSIIWESSTFVDSLFAPIDMEYIDHGSGNIQDNQLVVLDDIGTRLAVFSHDCDLIQLFDLYDPADSADHIYSAFTHKVNSNGSVTFYLADRNLSNVRRYVFTTDGNLDFVNEINVGNRMETSLSDVVYSDRFGLWAVESRGPHIFRLAENLSRVLFEVSVEQFNPQDLFHIQKVCLLPDRLVVLEPMSDNTGILSFAFEPPMGKRATRDEEIIPFTFALNQNYPNPFNPSTTVSFEIPSTQWVTLEIFNILGQKVTVLVDEKMAAGRYSLVWDGKNSAGRYVSSGVYFSRLSAGDNTEVKKMLMLK